MSAAEGGDAVAQYNSSKCYLFGWGTDKNAQKANHFLRLAAENKLPQATGELAKTYEKSAPLVADYWLNGATESRGNHYKSFENGCYYGETLSHMRDGYGTYVWDSGTIYSGEWQEDVRYGFGISFFPRMIHLGNYNEAPNGYGAAIVTDTLNHFAGAANSRVYVGNFTNGLPQGIGTLYDHGGTLVYHGNFNNGVPTNNYPTTDNYSTYRWVVEQLDGGDNYEGETVQGVREGFGIYRWADGSIWFGYWLDGKREGEGLYINSNGAMMAGVWHEGKLQ